MVNKIKEELVNNVPQTAADNSNKSILARGCDPHLSAYAQQALPPLMGNPEYVPVTDDVEFERLLRERKWSVVYFAPGACRFSAAKMQIPGGKTETRGWTLDEYKALVKELQGDNVQIVETPYEHESVAKLIEGLDKAKQVI